MVIFMWIISVLLLIIYWCWLFFMCKMFLSFLIDVYVIFLYWNISMNWTHFIFISHLLMLTSFGVENVQEFQYCFWLFTDVYYFSYAKCSYHSCLMVMWFSCTETYWLIADTSSSLVIYWCRHIFMCKMFQNFNITFDYLLMFTICHMQNVLIILVWCLCDFLALKHMNELYTLHFHWLFTDVDIILCDKCSRFLILLLIIYWCWLVQNVFIIIDWCLCDFLVLKHIHQWHILHIHWSFTNVDKLSLKFFLDKFHLKSVFESFVKQWL